MTKEKLSVKEKMTKARGLEREGDMSAAVKIYKGIIQTDPLHSAAYNRLMIIYRRQKQYRDELVVIKQGIDAYEKDLWDDQMAWKKANRRSATVSRSLAKSLGLLDDKGRPTYEDPHINTWRKREAVARRKLDTEKKKRSE